MEGIANNAKKVMNCYKVDYVLSKNLVENSRMEFVLNARKNFIIKMEYARR